MGFDYCKKSFFPTPVSMQTDLNQHDTVYRSVSSVIPTVGEEITLLIDVLGEENIG